MAQSHQLDRFRPITNPPVIALQRSHHHRSLAHFTPPKLSNEPDTLTSSRRMGNTNSIAPLGDVKKALDDPNTYVLDARTQKEIDASGKVEHSHWSQVDCTASSCPELEKHPERYVDDKAATVVIYCTSGRRAARAKQVLISQGYTGDILNAGGYYHVKSIRPCFRL
jgi:rhodanese-related sulfurtransferase